MSSGNLSIIIQFISCISTIIYFGLIIRKKKEGMRRTRAGTRKTILQKKTQKRKAKQANRKTD